MKNPSFARARYFDLRIATLPMEEYMASSSAMGRRARYSITLDAGYLRARLQDRRTAEEFQLFLNTVAGASRVLGCGRVVISVESSVPLTMRELSDLSVRFGHLGASPAHRIAILGAAPNPDTVGQFVEPYAHHRGVNVRDFANEAAALLWIRDRRVRHDRRSGRDRRLERAGRAQNDGRHMHVRRLEADRRFGADRRYCQASEWRT